MPGVGHVIALTFMSAIDDPERFRRSMDVGPWMGLTPGRDQSGGQDIVGGITRAGDAGLRSALYQAATVMLNRTGPNWLKAWAQRLTKLRGKKRATVALARRIGVVLHRMWGAVPSSASRARRRWRFGRHRRGCIPPAISSERRIEPRRKVAIHRCPLAGTLFPMMHVSRLVCRIALWRSSTSNRWALGNRFGPGMKLAAAALTTDGSESLAMDTDAVSALETRSEMRTNKQYRHPLRLRPGAGLHLPKAFFIRDRETGSRPSPVKKST